MTPSKGNWLGARLEEELKNVIEWIKHDKNPAFSSQLMAIDGHNYSYDGSNLWVNVEYAIEEPVVIQVLQFVKNKHPFNCLVCDSSTSIRAKFSKEAAIKLQNQYQVDNLAKISNGAILNIPKFRIMVAPSGPHSDRIQLLIDYVGIVNSQKVGRSGSPLSFHLRAGVAKLFNQVEQLMQPILEPEAPDILTSPRRTRVIKNGQYTQEFATQVRPTLDRAGFEMLDGTNLAPPVVPHRNDGAKVFGTKALSRANNQNAYHDLMSLLPGVAAAEKTACVVASALQPSASQPPSQTAPDVTHRELNDEGHAERDGNARDEDVDLTRYRPSHSIPQFDGESDGAVDDAIGRMNNYSYGNPHWHEMDEHELMSHIGCNRRSVPEIAQVPSHHMTSQDLPIREVVQSSKPRSWADILMHGFKRSNFICPDDQDALLERPESEYYPRPGKSFPSANIPIELLIQLHKAPVPLRNISTNVPDEDHDMEENLSVHEDEDDDDNEEAEPSGGLDDDDDDDDDDDEIIAEFSPTPPRNFFWADDLPPESSPPATICPKPRNLSRDSTWNISQITSGQHAIVTAQPDATPARYHDKNIDQPLDTAKMFSSAVRPGIILPGTEGGLRNSNNSQNTLSSDNFPDSSMSLVARTQQVSILEKVSQITPSSNSNSSSGRESWPATQLQPHAIDKPSTQSPGEKVLGTSLELLPGTQNLPEKVNQSVNIFSGRNDTEPSRNMGPPPTRVVLANLDGADSDVPSEVASAMAELQLLSDLKASVQQSSDDVQAPDTPARFSDGRSSQRNTPVGGAAISRKRREPSEMSPQEHREQKKSRFNFTQESPVSQDPAVWAAKAREEFLNARKSEKQPSEPPKVASSPPPIEPALDVTMEEDKDEDTSLYSEFRRAYPSYNGSSDHFEGMCKKLAASCKRGQLLCHPMLWDDFIARSVSDYMAYTQKRILAAQTVDPYERFYNEQIEGSLHDKKVVTRAKLTTWFGEEALNPSAGTQSRGPKHRGNHGRSGFGQRNLTMNMRGSGQTFRNQENQGAGRANPRHPEGNMPRGPERWRNP